MIKMSTDTGNNPTIKMRSYRTPFAKCPIVDKAVNNMLKTNIIHPFRSPWNLPIVVIDKKDGTKRFCPDFRNLNNISKKSTWPLPVIGDMLPPLGKEKYFAFCGYWQIPLNEDKEKMAFACHRNLYE